MHLLQAIALLLATALPLLGQTDCPHTRATNIPATFETGPAVACDAGVHIELGGVTVTTPQRSCPLMVVITPTHQEIEKAATATHVEPAGNAQELIAFFRCTPHYIIFVRISDTCDFEHTQVIGAVQLLRTVECNPKVDV